MAKPGFSGRRLAPRVLPVCQDVKIVTMNGGFGAGLKRFILWDYARASWQYDVMVGVILAFIFLTPREIFRDYPRPKNVTLVSAASGEASYWIDPDLMQGSDAADQKRAVESIIQAQPGGKNLKVLRIEPVYDGENEIRGYFAYARP